MNVSIIFQMVVGGGGTGKNLISEQQHRIYLSSERRVNLLEAFALKSLKNIQFSYMSYIFIIMIAIA